VSPSTVVPTTVARITFDPARAAGEPSGTTHSGRILIKSKNTQFRYAPNYNTGKKTVLGIVLVGRQTQKSQ
jgi:hypothetical protein